jgi:alpha-mannosidase
MPKITLHLIANAHLDPVWLWDWREGLNEGLITCRTILDLMDEYPEMTFMRGEAAIYEHIERTDLHTFERIRRYIKAGRWEFVGGTFIQPDTNLPGTETMARHFLRGQRYFRSRFGRIARVGWAADSFGHAAGLPEVMARAGIRGFAHTRPAAPKGHPAFWWEGPGGSRVLVYHPMISWYGTERAEMLKRLDGTLKLAQGEKLENYGVFYGLGDHGGGPSRRMLEEIRQWTKAHPEVRVRHSGLHQLIDALYGEAERKGEDFFPTHRGEMNFCLRGCYSSVAKLKFAYRKAEAHLARAESTDAAIRAALGQAPVDLSEAWDAVLFNSFHDVLPGSSIERAYDDQLAWLGGAVHRSHQTELDALNALAAQADTRVRTPEGDYPSAVAALVWNPLPRPYKGYVEIEASLDYRPIWAYNGKPDQLPMRVLGVDGRPLPFQVLATEHTAMVSFPWRKRVLVPLELPACGWNVVEFGWVEGAPRPPVPSAAVRVPKPGVIDNGIYRIEARVGAAGVRIFHKGRALFGNAGLGAAVYSDPWGSWGAMDEDPLARTLSNAIEKWKITAVETLESGPHRGALWVKLSGKNSRIELTCSLTRQREAVDLAARVLWNERSARLKLTMPAGDRAEFDVLGARVKRPPCGEVPGGRWVRVLKGDRPAFGFASDALYNFDCADGLFRATVCRASRYANDVTTAANERPYLPAVDCGELKFRCVLNPGDESILRLAEELETPPIMLPVPAHPGKLGRAGSFLSLAPADVKLLALKRAADGRGFLVRAQNVSRRTQRPRLQWLGRRLDLGVLPAGRIGCWKVTRSNGRWRADATDITEMRGKGAR